MPQNDLVLEIKVRDSSASGVNSATAKLRSLSAEAVQASNVIARAAVPDDYVGDMRKRLAARLEALRDANAMEIAAIKSHGEAVKYLRDQLGGDAGIAALSKGMTARQQTLLAALKREESDLKAHQGRLQKLIAVAPAPVGPSILARQAAVAARDPVEQMRRNIEAEIVGRMRSDGLRQRLEGEVRTKLFGNTADMAKDARDAGGVAGEQLRQGILEQLKSKFGRGSLLKEGLEIAAGTGVVAGFSLLGNVVADSFKGMRDFAHDWRDVNKSTTQIVSNLLTGLPIIGGWARAGKEIREAVTGEQAAIDAVLRGASQVDTARALRENLAGAIRRQKDQMAEQVFGFDARARIASVTDSAKENESRRSQHEAERRGLIAEAEARKEELRQFDQQIDALRKQRTAEAATIAGVTQVKRGSAEETAFRNVQRMDTDIAALTKQRVAAFKRVQDLDLPTIMPKLVAAQTAEDKDAADRQRRQEFADRMEKATQDWREKLAAMSKFYTNGADAARTLLAQRVQSLRNQGKGAEADRLELGQQFDDRRRALMGVVFGGSGVTLQQRLDAVTQLSSLGPEQQVALAKLGGTRSAARLASAQDFGRVNTLALAARENRTEDPAVAVAKQILEKAKEQAAKTHTLTEGVAGLIKLIGEGIHFVPAPSAAR